jgi:3-deoxy-D-manno-octulosonic-acid transferase
LFRHIFVQDENSVKLLQSHGIDHCSVSGDTRFDRVKKIASEFVEIELIKEFVLDRPVIVAGSTWEDDEKILSEYAIANKQIKFIIAPHEIDAKHLSNLSNKLINVLFYSQLFKEDKSGGFNYSALNDAQVLIIDQMGLLSRLYKYATIVYVGGGFTKDGIHNILEAAVYGKPVIFGRNYKKYREAKELIALGGAFSIASSGELIKIVDELLTNDELLTKAGIISGHYVSNNTGATEKVIEYIQEKRLLTN